MILAKELSQVTLEKAEENVTGKIGLSFVYHCMKDFGVEDDIQNGRVGLFNMHNGYFRS